MDPMWPISQSLISIWPVLQCWFLIGNIPWGLQRTLNTLVGLQQIYIHHTGWTPCDPFLKAYHPFGQCCDADSWWEIFHWVNREPWTHWLVWNNSISTIGNGHHVTHFSKPYLHLASVAMLIPDVKYSLGSIEDSEHIGWFATNMYPPYMMDPMWPISQSLISIWSVLRCWFLVGNIPWGQQRTLNTLVGLQ